MFVRGIYMILCLSVLVKCESTRIKVSAIIERNNNRSTHYISAQYENNNLWIRYKDIPTLIKLEKDNDMQVKILSINKCTLEHIEKDALDKYTESDEFDIYDNNLKELKSGVIKGKLWKAFLRRNKIKQIEEGAFSNLPNLKEVYLGHNEIEEINPRWFSNCPKLGVLNLLGNKIKHIARNSFANMSNVYTVNLDFNQISSIEPGAFDDLADLNYFGLSFNQITVLSSDIFPRFLEVEIFDISFNHLNYISIETLERLRVRNIHLIPNPWKCECLQNVENWVLKNKFHTFVYVHCSGPQYPVCIKKTIGNQVCDEKFDMELSKEFYNGYWSVCRRSHFDYSDKDINYDLKVIYM